MRRDRPRHRPADRSRRTSPSPTGFVVHAWTFGGTVPGPDDPGPSRRHGQRPPRPTPSTMSHSIDFHASQTAMNDQMVEIKPGETFTYTFTADYAGVWMYHCGTAPALHHIANGMFGMVIVEPKGGLPKVDQRVRPRPERVVPRPARGEPARLRQGSAAAPGPRLRRLQRRRQPVQGQPDRGHDRRAASGSSSSTPGRTSTARSTSSARSSTPSPRKASSLVKGNAGGWGSQAVDLSPAQGAIIEFSPQEDGMYPDRHPRLQLRRQGRARHLHGRRRRSEELTFRSEPDDRCVSS